MSRKAEAGISYFPLNTDIIHSNKIKLIVSEFGARAWAVIIPLLCKVYRDKGYYIDWADEDMKLLFAQDECRCDLSFVNEVVSRLIKRGVFNEPVFSSFGILTSDRIQENYLEAKKRSKEVVIFEDVTLIDINVYTNCKSVDGNPKNVNTSTQNKVKGRIKGKGEHAPPANTKDEIDLFKNFKDWIDKNTPRVNQMKEPLTMDQYFNLRKKVTKDVLKNVLTAMQNRADLLRRYVSANLTIQDWSKRENVNLPIKDSELIEKKSHKILNDSN